MKIGWGTKIGILYGAFVALILVLVSLSMGQKVELESKDYYAKELAFEEKISATKNANALEESISYEVKEDRIEIYASQKIAAPIQGEVFLFRPSDSSLDKTYALKFDVNGKQYISNSELKNGVYKIQFSWKSNGVNYYKEGVINIK